MYYGDFMLFDEAGKLEKGERVFLGDVKGRNEGWLRDTLFKNPEIIPVSDIDPTFGPLVPLCKELRTEAGQIDAVFVNERGRLTIVECKLWKNPQARREVVAQTLHYVSALSGWFYADLQRQVATELGWRVRHASPQTFACELSHQLCNAHRTRVSPPLWSAAVTRPIHPIRQLPNG